MLVCGLKVLLHMHEALGSIPTNGCGLGEESGSRDGYINKTQGQCSKRKTEILLGEQSLLDSNSGMLRGMCGNPAGPQIFMYGWRWSHSALGLCLFPVLSSCLQGQEQQTTAQWHARKYRSESPREGSGAPTQQGL